MEVGGWRARTEPGCTLGSQGSKAVPERQARRSVLSFLTWTMGSGDTPPSLLAPLLQGSISGAGWDPFSALTTDRPSAQITRKQLVEGHTLRNREFLELPIGEST